MVVKVNKASDTGSAQIMSLEAGQELSLSIDAELAPMMEINKQQTVMHRTIFVGNDNFPASLYHPTFA